LSVCADDLFTLSSFEPMEFLVLEHNFMPGYNPPPTLLPPIYLIVV
jgi:hypothetical protein